MHRVLVQRGAVVYRLFAFEFRDHADGSFYFELKTADREGKPSRRQKISYHATGKIKFSGALNHVIFGEPIFSLGEPQTIACFSLADLNVLPEAARIGPTDLILHVPEQDCGRVNLHLVIAPDDAAPIERALTISYAGWFKLSLSPGPVPLPDLAPDSTRIVAGATRYTQQAVAQSDALIFFHQKQAGEKGLLAFWDSATKTVRLIFAVPMRVPPALMVEFAEEELEAVPQSPRILNTATTELRFKVRGPGGYLAQPPRIKKLSLDAELHGAPGISMKPELSFRDQPAVLEQQRHV